MPKKIPMRRCVATGEQLPKKELLRVVRTPEGEVRVDPTGKANGHGAYLKKDPAAVEAAKKKGALKRALDTEIPEEFWETLKQAVQK
jgi:predicted RNA-binding protein YlxR (DUF448 family)